MSHQSLDLASISNDHYESVYRFALSLTRDPEDAADLTQDAFLKLHRKADTVHRATKSRSWLFTVVHHCFVDKYRRRQRFPTCGLDKVAEPPQPEARPPGEKLDARLALRVLGELPEHHQMPLRLFYLEGRSYKDIAAAMGVPMGTVMSRMRRAKDQLRKRMEEGVQPEPGKRE